MKHYRMALQLIFMEVDKPDLAPMDAEIPDAPPFSADPVRKMDNFQEQLINLAEKQLATSQRPPLSVGPEPARSAVVIRRTYDIPSPHLEDIVAIAKEFTRMGDKVGQQTEEQLPLPYVLG